MLTYLIKVSKLALTVDPIDNSNNDGKNRDRHQCIHHYIQSILTPPIGNRLWHCCRNEIHTINQFNQIQGLIISLPDTCSCAAISKTGNLVHVGLYVYMVQKFWHSVFFVVRIKYFVC